MTQSLKAVRQGVKGLSPSDRATLLNELETQGDLVARLDTKSALLIAEATAEGIDTGNIPQRIRVIIQDI